MTRSREIAKFFCGFEAFHALAHGYLWASGTDLTVMGIGMEASWNLFGLFLHAAIAVALGVSAWRNRRRVLAAVVIGAQGSAAADPWRSAWRVRECDRD